MQKAKGKMEMRLGIWKMIINRLSSHMLRDKTLDDFIAVVVPSSNVTVFVKRSLTRNGKKMEVALGRVDYADAFIVARGRVVPDASAQLWSVACGPL